MSHHFMSMPRRDSASRLAKLGRTPAVSRITCRKGLPRTIAEVLLGFSGTKEDWEVDPRRSKTRRLIAHGTRMMRGGYRVLLHYPFKTGGH